ncbi:MAG: tetratricopeptide repeat protein [Deltaproteobacteria bacterium]|nr:tetratricopeptide repeat protein [Deltaproteobacteria bacterium]
MRASSRLLALQTAALLFLTLTFWPSASFPSPPADKESSRQRASALLKRGNTAHDAGDFVQALLAYRQAFSIYPSYKLQLNISQTLVALRRYGEAAEALERFISAGRRLRASPTVLARAQAKRHELMREHVATLTLDCGARQELLIDGRSRGACQGKRSFLVSAGSRQLRLGAAKPITIRIAARETRRLSLTAEHAARKAPPPPRTATAPPSAPAIPTSPPAQVAPKPSPLLAAAPQPTTRWNASRVLFVASAAGAAATTACYLIGGISGQRAHRRYSEAVLQSEIDRHWQDVVAARRWVIAGHLMLGATALTLGSALYLSLRKSPERRSTEKSQWLGLAPIGDGLLLSYDRAF